MVEFLAKLFSLIEKIHIGKIMNIIILFIIIFLCTPKEVQNLINSINMPFIPRNGLLCVAVLAISYWCAEVINIICFHFKSKFKANKENKIIQESIKVNLLSLDDNEKVIILKYVKSNTNTLSLPIFDQYVNSLLAKKIIILIKIDPWSSSRVSDVCGFYHIEPQYFDYLKKHLCFNKSFPE